MDENTKNLPNDAQQWWLLLKNLSLHAIIEEEVRETPFGQITFTVEIEKGRAKIETMTVLKSKRIKYKSRANVDKNSKNVL